MNLRAPLILVKETFIEWFDDKCPKLAAALSFYTAFALAPLLIFVIGIAGQVFDEEAARGQIVAQMKDLIGTDGAQVIEQLVLNASRPETSIIAAIFGIISLIIGATGVFVELKDSLDMVWDVPPPQEQGFSIMSLIKTRFLSFAMIFGVGFLLIVSLVVSAILSAMTKYIGDIFPGMTLLMGSANFVVSLSIITVLFAMMFKFLPDVKVRWGDVWIGAFFTAALFTLGKFLIGLYLGRGTIGSVYGAAGSFAVLLLWIYYSAQIFFLGAEFTQVFSRREEFLGKKKSVNGSKVPRERDSPHQSLKEHPVV